MDDGGLTCNILCFLSGSRKNFGGDLGDGLAGDVPIDGPWLMSSLTAENVGEPGLL